VVLLSVVCIAAGIAGRMLGVVTVIFAWNTVAEQVLWQKVKEQVQMMGEKGASSLLCVSNVETVGVGLGAIIVGIGLLLASVAVWMVIGCWHAEVVAATDLLGLQVIGKKAGCGGCGEGSGVVIIIIRGAEVCRWKSTVSHPGASVVVVGICWEGVGGATGWCGGDGGRVVVIISSGS